MLQMLFLLLLTFISFKPALLGTVIQKLLLATAVPKIKIICRNIIMCVRRSVADLKCLFWEIVYL